MSQEQKGLDTNDEGLRRLPVNMDRKDRRFSTLFVLPSRSDTGGAGAKASPSKIKRMLGCLLSPYRSTKTTTSVTPISREEEGQSLWDTVIGTSNTPPKAPSRRSTVLRKKKAPGPSQPRQPGAISPMTVHPPASLKSFIRRNTSTWSKHQSKDTDKITNPSRDSKFSSISSVPSTTTANPTPSTSLTTPLSTRPSTAFTNINLKTIMLTPNQQAHLLSLTRRLHRRLTQQEYHTTALSLNLLFLLRQKRFMLQDHPGRRGVGEVRKMVGAIGILGGRCRKVFVLKAALLQSSFAIVGRLKSLLEEGGKGTKKERGMGGEGCSVSREDVMDILDELNSDVQRQRDLDREMGAMVSEGAKERRWIGCRGEGVMMIRFLEFFAGRLEVMEGVYGGMEVMLGGFEDAIGEEGYERH